MLLAMFINANILQRGIIMFYNAYLPICIRIQLFAWRKWNHAKLTECHIQSLFIAGIVVLAAQIKR